MAGAQELSDRSKSDLLEELLDQARAAREERGQEQEVGGEQGAGGAPAGTSVLDHLLDKAMMEKVSRDSDSFRPSAPAIQPGSGAEFSFHDDTAEGDVDTQQSRFKYLFFKIFIYIFL